MTEQDLLTLFDDAIKKGIEKTNEMSAGMSAPVVIHEVLREIQESLHVGFYELQQKAIQEAVERSKGVQELRVLDTGNVRVL